MEPAGQKFFKYLLFVGGVILLFLIGSNMANVYRGSIQNVNTTEEAEKNVDCYQMSFNVDFKNPNVLSVENMPLSSFDLEILTFVEYSTQDRVQKKQTFFVPGSRRDIDISDLSFDEFFVYPFSCTSIARICNQSTTTCYDPNQYNE